MDRRLIRDLDILTLQLFVAICEEGNLTRAARREAIAPSAVSKRLADLESALNAELFHRGGTGMTLTSAGETMLRYSRRMLESIESVGTELREYARGTRGFVRLRANIGAIVQFLPGDLKSFAESRPEIRIELEERASRAAVDDVERGIVDLGICSGIVESMHLSSAVYRRHRLLLVVNDAHPLAARGMVDFRETLDFDHIMLGPDSAICGLLSAYANHISVPLRTRLHVPGFDAMFRMVQADLGVSIVPDGVFSAIGAPMGLVSVALKDTWAEREMKIVHRGEHSLSPAGKLLLKHLVGEANRHAVAIPAGSPEILVPDWARNLSAQILQ